MGPPQQRPTAQCATSVSPPASLPLLSAETADIGLRRPTEAVAPAAPHSHPTVNGVTVPAPAPAPALGDPQVVGEVIDSSLPVPAPAVVRSSLAKIGVRVRVGGRGGGGREGEGNL